MSQAAAALDVVRYIEPRRRASSTNPTPFTVHSDRRAGRRNAFHGHIAAASLDLLRRNGNHRRSPGRWQRDDSDRDGKSPAHSL